MNIWFWAQTWVDVDFLAVGKLANWNNFSDDLWSQKKDVLPSPFMW